MNEQNPSPATEMEVIASNTSLEQIERAQYDIAVSTAHKYPRDIKLFLRDAISLVQTDQETAESCIYRRPVGKKGNQVEYAEGMSVRMAEIVACCYGNIAAQSMIVEQTPRFVKCRGQARDLQRNVNMSSEVVEPTVTKEGRPYSEAMRTVVAKSCLSKAKRDAIFNVVPKALCKPIEAAARQVITGSAKPLSERRAAVMTWISKSSIGEARVWAALGIKSVEELGNDQLVELQGIRTAIKEGEVTIDDAFPKIEEPATVDRFAGKKEAAPTNGTKPAEPDRQTKRQTTPPRDPRAELTEIIMGRQATIADFIEVMVGDDQIKPADAAGIKSLADVPTGVVLHYLGADWNGEECVRGLNFVFENRKQ